MFLKLSNKNKVMLIEAYFLLGWARLIKNSSFSRLSSKLGELMGETTKELKNEDCKILKEVSQMIHLASKHTFWESECLVKALAARIMLKRRHIESTLYLGTGKDENGYMIAHAWVRSGPFYITGAEVMEKFTVVASFAHHSIQ